MNLYRKVGDRIYAFDIADNGEVVPCRSMADVDDIVQVEAKPASASAKSSPGWFFCKDRKEPMPPEELHLRMICHESRAGLGTGFAPWPQFIS